MQKNHKTLAVACLLTAAVSMLLIGCSVKKPAAKKNPLISNINIVTNCYPSYIETLNIASGIKGVSIANMNLPTTATSPNEAADKKDIALLKKADIFIVNGLGIGPSSDVIKKGYPKLFYIDASAAAKPILQNGLPNPYLFVSIDGNIGQVREIAAKLADADPLHAVDYKRNSDTYIEKLEQLQQKMHTALDQYKGSEVITFNAPFTYFSQEFGLTAAAISETTPKNPTNAAVLADAIKIAEEKGIRCIFAEPQYSTASAAAITRETHAKLYILDPAVTGPSTADAYIKTMENNLIILVGALKTTTTQTAIQ